MDKQQRAKPNSSTGALAGMRRAFGAGLVLLTPVVITYLLVHFVFKSVDDILQPGIHEIFGHDVPGLGAGILLVAIFVVGLFSATYLMRKGLAVVEGVVMRVPFVNAVYGTIKLIIVSFSGSTSTGFKRVVMLEYPMKDAWTIAFLTSLTTDADGKPAAVVYVPAGPSPHTGFIAILPMDRVHDTDMSVQDALQFLLSAGVVTPPQITRRPITVESLA